MYAYSMKDFRLSPYSLQVYSSMKVSAKFWDRMLFLGIESKMLPAFRAILLTVKFGVLTVGMNLQSTVASKNIVVIRVPFTI